MACVDVRAWRNYKLSVAAFAGAGAVLLIGAWTTDAVPRAGARTSAMRRPTSARPARPAWPSFRSISSGSPYTTRMGAMLRSPVSTGKPGYETPPGIFTVLEKKVEHYSNVY